MKKGIVEGAYDMVDDSLSFTAHEIGIIRLCADGIMANLLHL